MIFPFYLYFTWMQASQMLFHLFRVGCMNIRLQWKKVLWFAHSSSFFYMVVRFFQCMHSVLLVCFGAIYVGNVDARCLGVFVRLFFVSFCNCSDGSPFRLWSVAWTWLHYTLKHKHTTKWKMYACRLAKHFYFSSTKFRLLFSLELNLWNGSTTFILPKALKYDKLRKTALRPYPERERGAEVRKRGW